MGKQAKQRKENRIRLLKRLALEDPEGFLVEWNTRIQTWMYAIWAQSKDEARFTEKEYNDFIQRYPHAHTILAPLIRYNDEFCICLNRVKLYHEEELGAEAFNELLKHVHGGVLKGGSLFEFIEKAKNILMECGDSAVVKLALKETADVLGNECCRVLAMSVGSELYRINGTYDRKYVSKTS